MNQQLIHHVPFHEETLLVVEDSLGERFVAMKPTVEALNLNWSGQYRRLNRHPVLSSTVCIMQTVPAPQPAPRPVFNRLHHANSCRRSSAAPKGGGPS